MVLSHHVDPLEEQHVLLMAGLSLQPQCVAQAGLKIMILLPLPLQHILPVCDTTTGWLYFYETRLALNSNTSCLRFWSTEITDVP